MPLGDNYATRTELKAYLQITDTADDTELDDALNSTSRGVERFCQRQFNQVTAASPRTFKPSRRFAYVDDFHTTTDLVVEVDDDGDGTFETTVTDFDLEPLDGVVDGEPGWPFWIIRLLGTSTFRSGRGSLRVTAQWGWAAVPAPVKQATLIVASETFKLKDAPFGVAGFGDFGVVRVRNNPIAASKLAPYVRDPVLVA